MQGGLQRRKEPIRSVGEKVPENGHNKKGAARRNRTRRDRRNREERRRA
jgi:hypothetical protein